MTSRIGVEELRIVATGGSLHDEARQHAHRGNNTVAREPRVVFARDRNNQTNTTLRTAGGEVMTLVGAELGHGRRVAAP